MAEHDLLFRTHYRHVLSYLAFRLPLEDAKDVASEVFATAWRQRDDVLIDDERGWLPWLLTVARRKAAAWWAAKAATVPSESDIPLMEEPDFVDRIAEIDSANRRLSAALASLKQLGADDREILELCGLLGLTPAQAAITLGLPASTTRARLHRARQRLLDLIDIEDES